MARVFITGSSDGLGLVAAKQLVRGGHDVVLHARNAKRADDARRALSNAKVVIGDFASTAGAREVARGANALGRFDAVIHNAGVGDREGKTINADGVEHLFAINVLAPYVVTALMERPARLIYLSSGMHRGGDADALDDLEWEHKRWNGSQAYSDTKLFDTTLAFALARRWPEVQCHSIDPGWVPTKMGGRGAPDDLEAGADTQAWLAAGEDPQTQVTGVHWFHRKPREVHPAARDHSLQAALLERCASLSGVALR